jgi:hypothetical protein
LARAIVGTAIFLEFTDDVRLDPDAAVEAMEQLAAELQKLDPAAKTALVEAIIASASTFEANYAEFVRSLPDALGLE